MEIFMKRRFMCILLALVMVTSLVVLPPVHDHDHADAAEVTSSSANHWFYDQLNDQAKKIYNTIEKAFKDGKMKDGTSDVDLAEGTDAVPQDSITAYLGGNTTLFNDFAAAKDAFDLEHPEAWYIDSSYLTFRVTTEADGKLHAYCGTGRGLNYYVKGIQNKEDVESKTATLDNAVNEIVKKAQSENSTLGKIRSVHKSITESISYRFENECTPGNEGYIRTVYALVTHEGVCESYSRAFQLCMQKLNIPCVLIHGTQNSGDPEAHMWNAVYLDVPSDDAEAGIAAAAEDKAWYAVDATWDDPIKLDKEGNVVVSQNGVDGAEHERYFLVGEDTLDGKWQPSGFVSTSSKEFTYPTITYTSYFKRNISRGDLKVETVPSSTSGTVATEYRISYKDMGLFKAKEAGYYFLFKAESVHLDGSLDAIEEWYYVEHGYAYQHGTDFYDTDDYLVMKLSQCEYLEYAVTTRRPDFYDSTDPFASGYYNGDFSDIVAETGVIYNENGGYEGPPYVCNVYPSLTSSASVGQNYRCHVEFTQDLYRPTEEDLARFPGSDAGDIAKVLSQTPHVDFVGMNYNWGYHVESGGFHQFAQRPDITNLTYLYHCEEDHEHSIDKCRIYGVEFNFTPSPMWADDSVMYIFTLYGLVGTQSNKIPGTWGYCFQNSSGCPACWRSQGIDWNLWGQPSLLDNVGDLDLDKMILEGTDGERENLQQLTEEMHLDPYGMNGRLAISVTPTGEGRAKSEEAEEALEKDGQNVEDIISSLLYEIDFVRICGKTIVNPGQSLRLCMGFPAGFDASDLDEVTFKVYHFLRDEEAHCPDPNNPNHEHTGEIYKVEEIPITVTPYGLIIVVNNFSPFEIVAEKKTDTPAAAAENETHTLVVASNGNGHLSYKKDGAEVTAAGADGMVKFGPNDSITFTVVPEDGYELDKITFSDSTIEVKDNTFTLTYDQVSDGSLLSADFAPTTLIEGEKERGEEVAAVTVCTHENVTGGVVTDATCIHDGHITAKVCSKCGQTIAEAQTITAQGHTYVNNKCVKCGRDIHPNGADAHEWDDGIVTELANCGHDGQKEYTCTVCGAKKTESYRDAIGDHTWDNGKVTKEPSCGEDGVKTYTCTKCGVTKTETIPMTGEHKVKEDGDCTTPDYCTVCGKEVTPAKAEHNFTPWTASEADYSNHHRACQNEGCTVKEAQPHSGKDDQNCETPVECEVCGLVFVSGTTHTYDTKWEWNESAHFHTCTNKDHDGNPCTHTESYPHMPVTDDGSCLTGVHCQQEGCGYVFYEGQKDHNWSAWEDNGNGTHSRHCINDGCEATETKEHSGGTATCTDKAVCQDCQAKYGELDPENHGNHPTELRNYKAPTEDEAGYSGDYYCTGCDKVVEEGHELPKADHVHTFGDEWKSDGTHHWHECTKCGARDESSYTTHTFDSWAPGADGHTHKCTVCGHTATEDHVPQADDGDCSTPVLCDICRDTVVEAKAHDFGGIPVGAAEGHYHLCQNPGCSVKSETETHSGGTATCYTQAICSTCATVYGALDPNNHAGGETVVGYKDATATEPGYTGDVVCLGCGAVLTKGTEIPAGEREHDWQWEYDDLNHWRACPRCGQREEGSFGHHQYNGDGICTTCGATDPFRGHEHKWSDYTVEKEPTCVDTGVKYRVCTECGVKEIEDIPATGVHTWDQGKVTTSPDCVHEGVFTYTCTVCGATRTEKIPATGKHFYVDGKCNVCGEKEPANTPQSPATDDNMPTIVVFSICIILAGAISAMVLKRRRRN